MLVKLVAQPGVSAVYSYAEPANFNSHLVRLRLKPEVDPEYLVSYLNSDFGQSLIRSFTTGSVRPVVTLAALLSLPVHHAQAHQRCVDGIAEAHVGRDSIGLCHQRCSPFVVLLPGDTCSTQMPVQVAEVQAINNG